MADKNVLTDQINRGTKSDMLLEVLAGKFDEMELECFEVFKKSDLQDDEGRKNLRLHIKAMGDLKDRLENDVIVGNNAQKRLAKENSEEKDG